MPWFMRSYKLLFGLVLILTLCTSCSLNSKIEGKVKDPIIFAVNIEGGIGYFADEKGVLLFGKQFEYVKIFSEGFAAVKLNGKYGFINTKGEVVVPCAYEGAWIFSEGLAAVKLNGKWGYINTKGEVVIPCVYESARPFSKGFAKVKLNGKRGVINKEGKWIIQPIADYIYW